MTKSLSIDRRLSAELRFPKISNRNDSGRKVWIPIFLDLDVLNRKVSGPEVSNRKFSCPDVLDRDSFRFPKPISLPQDFEQGAGIECFKITNYFSKSNFNQIY